TVARTLAVLLMDFKFQGTHEHSLPLPQEQPLFVKHESLYRFLLRAVHQDPDMRFQSADEMAEQLLGILRETVAEVATPRPADSPLFGGDPLALMPDESSVNAGASYRLLPALKLDALDPAANLLLAAATMPASVRTNVLKNAVQQRPDSAEAPLRLADDRIT